MLSLCPLRWSWQVVVSQLLNPSPGVHLSEKQTFAVNVGNETTHHRDNITNGYRISSTIRNVEFWYRYRDTNNRNCRYEDTRYKIHKSLGMFRTRLKIETVQRSRRWRFILWIMFFLQGIRISSRGISILKLRCALLQRVVNSNYGRVRFLIFRLRHCCIGLLLVRLESLGKRS